MTCQHLPPRFNVLAPTVVSSSSGGHNGQQVPPDRHQVAGFCVQQHLLICCVRFPLAQ